MATRKGNIQDKTTQTGFGRPEERRDVDALPGAGYRVPREAASEMCKSLPDERLLDEANLRLSAPLAGGARIRRFGHRLFM